MNRSKVKDNKIINSNGKRKGKETPTENKNEKPFQKIINTANKISINKNIKKIKKGNKSLNPRNGLPKKKIILGKPKQRQGQIIKISLGKNLKEKTNSAKKRVNTENNNSENKNPSSRQGQKNIKTMPSRKNEKSPNPNVNINKK